MSQVREPPTWRRAAPFLAGVLSPIVASRITHGLGVENLAGIVVAGAIVFFVTAAWSSFTSPSRLWTVPLLIFAGVPIGTTLDAAISSQSHNLFPLEIVMWLIVAVVPATFGTFLGRTWREGHAK